MYLVCIVGLLERRPRFVVFALPWASLHLAFQGVHVALVVVAVHQGVVTIDDAMTKVELIVGAAWVLAIAQLVWHLTLSFKGIRYDMAGRADIEQEGFEVIQC